MRVPKQFADAADAQVIVRLESSATGKIEAKRKLGELPKGEGSVLKAIRTLFN